MRWTARLAAWWRSVDRRALDAAVALLCTVEIWLGLAGKSLEPGQHPTTWVAYVLAALVAAPLTVHRRHPLVAAAVSNAALVAYSAGAYSAYPGLPAFALVFLVAPHFGRRIAAATFALTAFGLSVAILLQPPGVATTSTWVATTLALAVAWLLGENQRARRGRWLALEERAARSEADREQRAREAVVAERLRIARELHDVVAHAMSVIAVQSGMGRHVIATRPDEARKALSSIEFTSRAALTEMRRLLGVLRSGDEPQGALAPAPGLGDVPDLVRQMRTAGLEVDLAVDLEVDPERGSDDEAATRTLPPGVDLSAYRVVQEGLTNVLRHGGSRVWVRIRRTTSGVEVEVVDDGVPGDRRRPAAFTAEGVPSAASPSGHGLIGVRERVAVFAGEFSAGPRPGGGFRLVASLPFDAPAQPSVVRP